MQSEDNDTTLELWIDRLRRILWGKQKEKAHAMRASFNRSDNTWASSVGGPGLNFGEHIAGRSRFGTAHMRNWSTLKIGSLIVLPRKPSPGRSSSGSAISAFTPQTIVVSPKRMSAD